MTTVWQRAQAWLLDNGEDELSSFGGVGPLGGVQALVEAGFSAIHPKLQDGQVEENVGLVKTIKARRSQLGVAPERLLVGGWSQNRTDPVADAEKTNGLIAREGADYWLFSGEFEYKGDPGSENWMRLSRYLTRLSEVQPAATLLAQGRIMFVSMPNEPAGPNFDWQACRARNIRWGPECLTPETRVLTRDLRWKPSGDLEVGDDLVGFDEHRLEHGAQRKITPATVAAVGGAHRPGYAMYLSDGTMLRCSAEHLWLVVAGGDHRYRRMDWASADKIAAQLRQGQRPTIARYFQPWREESGWDVGYLAGLLDGEGSLCLTQNKRDGDHNFMVNISQRPGTVLDEAKRILGKLGVHFGVSLPPGRDVAALNLQGMWQEKAAALGAIRPKRLVQKFVETPLPRFGMRAMDVLEVVEMRPIAKLEIVPMATTSRTYFAEGFASHNCYPSEFPTAPSQWPHTAQQVANGQFYRSYTHPAIGMHRDARAQALIDSMWRAKASGFSWGYSVYGVHHCSTADLVLFRSVNKPAGTVQALAWMP